VLDEHQPGCGDRNAETILRVILKKFLQVLGRKFSLE
jgi:hypothetical protein